MKISDKCEWLFRLIIVCLAIILLAHVYGGRHDDISDRLDALKATVNDTTHYWIGIYSSSNRDTADAEVKSWTRYIYKRRIDPDPDRTQQYEDSVPCRGMGGNWIRFPYPDSVPKGIYHDNQKGLIWRDKYDIWRDFISKEK